ncbi:LysM peptidoglycan-binding domain-containing protein [Cohnella algarum]|nr:LysM domain-containing protein [Cohnella algarum]MBN2980109.1 LysM peptidoglycan-binding domain-containing protein [Cohnella algarum]
MYISWNNNEEGWPFPILPGKVTIKREGSGKEYRIIGTGPIQTIEKPKLAEISFESFFPGNSYPFINPKHFQTDGKPDAHRYVYYINKWMHSGYPVRFSYIGSNINDDKTKIWLPMTIESFERWEQGGSPGDIFYSLKLKEYVFFAPARARPVQQPDGTTKLVKEQAQAWDPRVPQATYTLKPGDTLLKVARLQLGDSGRWREIQQLNNITDSELKRLQPGRVLQMPARRT